MMQAESRIQAREHAKRMAKAVRKMSLTLDGLEVGGFERLGSVVPEDLDLVNHAEIEAFLAANATNELFMRFAAFGSDEYRASAMGMRATTMDLHEFLELLKHIRVSPQRLSKTTAVSVFEDVNHGKKRSGADDDDEHELCFQEFCECMRRIGQRISLMNATNTLSEATTAVEKLTVSREPIYMHLVSDQDVDADNADIANLHKIKVWDRSRQEVVALVEEDKHFSPLRGKLILNRRASMPEQPQQDLLTRLSQTPAPVFGSKQVLTPLQASGFVLKNAPQQWHHQQQHPQHHHHHQQRQHQHHNADLRKSTGGVHLKPVSNRKDAAARRSLDAGIGHRDWPGTDGRITKGRGHFERSHSDGTPATLAHYGSRRGLAGSEFQLPAIFRDAPAHKSSRLSGLGIRRSTSCPPEPPSNSVGHRPSIGALSSLGLDPDQTIAFHMLVKTEPLHAPSSTTAGDDFVHPHLRSTSPTSLTVQELLESALPSRPSGSHLHRRPS